MTLNSQDPDPLQENSKYSKIRLLGSGAFGLVQQAQHKQTGEYVAIKFIGRGENITKYVETEILNHRHLRHPHVIEFKEVFLTRDYVCIVMEYASSGNLFDYVKKAGKLQEAAARWFFQQLIIALDYCHRKGVVNRDIKLENTLLQYIDALPLPLVKICDFGYSKSQFLSDPKSKVGTVAYMAPEVLSSTGKYDGMCADIWSCGVMLYLMLFGAYPFEPGAQQTRKILDAEFIMPENSAHHIVSQEARAFLRELLQKDPNNRITVQGVFQNAWFCKSLPPHALSMNDGFLANPDFTGVQSEEEVQRVIAEARLQRVQRHTYGYTVCSTNYNTMDASLTRGLEDMIDSAIEEDELQASD